MCFYIGFFTFASEKHKKTEILQRIKKNSLFGLFFDPQNGAFSYKKPPKTPRGASQENPRSPQEPPGSFFESPGSLLEPSGVDFGASGVDQRPRVPLRAPKFPKMDRNPPVLG